MAMFDADEFMTQTVDQPLETEFKLCPEGEFPMMIDDFDSRAIVTYEFVYSKGDRAGQDGSMTKLTLPFIVNDDGAKALLGRDKVIVPTDFILDLDDTGHLAHGTNKNVKLGQVREAVNQNQSGPWSFAQLRGAGPFMGRVKHVDITLKDGSKIKKAEVVRFVKMR